MTEKTELFLIVGPTACGKSALSLSVAKKMDAEIISADSIQIYRGMDIGSAKVTKEEQLLVKHHLLDVTDVCDSDFSVARFQSLACASIKDIVKRGHRALVVGGTGLYINSLTYPLNFTNTASSPEYRKELTELEAKNDGYAYSLLRKVDPKSAKRLHVNDKKRIIRALEVYHATGKTIGEYGDDFQNSANSQIPYNPHIIGLNVPRAVLYERIEKRVDNMIACGLIDEVKALYERYPNRALPAFQGLGYKQIIGYLEGECSYDDAIAKIKLDTRHFAKRQMTWFKRDNRIVWADTPEADCAIRIFGGKP